MRLQPDQPAPAFTAVDLFGEAISLDRYRGRRLMLSFYRYAACPLCNIRVHSLIQRHGDFRSRGLEMVAVFESPAESIREYVGRQDAPFPIVPDPERALYRQYGVESSLAGFAKGGLRIRELIAALSRGLLKFKFEGDIFIIPADFLIESDGTIATAYYGTDIGDHLAIDEIDRWLDAPPIVEGALSEK